jgi:hypothetical protein
MMDSLQWAFNRFRPFFAEAAGSGSRYGPRNAPRSGDGKYSRRYAIFYFT